jgi:beta-galactosidase
LPDPVKVRHGRNARGKLLHYYLNFAGREQQVVYAYRAGSDLLAGASVHSRQTLTLKPSDLAIVPEQQRLTPTGP